MIRNVVRMLEKAGFAIFMFSVVAVAIGFAEKIWPLVYAGIAVVLVCSLIVLYRANRAVAKRPRPHPAGENGAAATAKSSARHPSNISDPDRY